MVTAGTKTVTAGQLNEAELAAWEAVIKQVSATEKLCKEAQRAQKRIRFYLNENDIFKRNDANLNPTEQRNTDLRNLRIQIQDANERDLALYEEHQAALLKVDDGEDRLRKQIEQHRALVTELLTNITSWQNELVTIRTAAEAEKEERKQKEEEAQQKRQEKRKRDEEEKKNMKEQEVQNAAKRPKHSNKPAKRPSNLDDYQVRMGSGWTTNDGTFGQVPLADRSKADVPHPTYVNEYYRAVNGLTSLQISRNAPITMCAMDVAVDHIFKSLPSEARLALYIPPPNGPALWSEEDAMRKPEEQKEGKGATEQSSIKKETPKEKATEAADKPTPTMKEAMYAKMSEDVYKKGGEYIFYAHAKQRPWTVWPVWVEDRHGRDWVTVMWHATPRDAAHAPDVFDRVLAYTIIDPRRDPSPPPLTPPPTKNGKGGQAAADGVQVQQRNGVLADRQDRLRSRLLDFLHAGGYDVSDAQDYQVRGPPMPLGERSSGERCFAAVKQLAHAVTQWVVDGGNSGAGAGVGAAPPAAAVFAHLPRWLNPYQARVEMAGICAWMAMACVDFDARVAVEALVPNRRIPVVADGRRRTVENYDLSGTRAEQSTIAAQDYFLPAVGYVAPSKKKKARGWLW
ncbi:hypothetical protein GGR56DRAFT_695698 [Xylariaceae sp. FL0804]|nr:hypothetical protein GGR56DRAFT_695698 [Xylariaceae sp. FL0804]